MLKEDIYFVAYQKLYSNKGARTNGITEETTDGFNEEKVREIIKKLAMETYQPTPVKRVYIKKSNGKMRYLGIPSFMDKLVEKVLRLILEVVYEPIFSEKSHGFRPKKNCHTTLKDIKHAFPGTRGFIEGDVKGCFDSIEHETLIKFFRKKIKDARLI